MHTRLSTPALAAITTLATALIAVSLGPCATPAHAASFTFYNDTSYPNADLGTNFGMTDSAVIYDDWNMSCSTTGCSNVPAQGNFEWEVRQQVSAYKASANAPITLDFENILPVSATSAAQAAQEVTLLHELITWAHDAEPSAPIGEYSYDYSTSYNSYTAQLYTSGYLDYFAPSLYTRWSTMAQWQTELNAAVANDHSIDSSLPIYPYIWPQYDNQSTKPFTTYTDWDRQLKAVEAQTQGAIVWSGTTALGSSACGWLGAMSYETGVLQGSTSHGPLTVTATPPNTCELTRSAETAIPVTFTNNTSATSAAATLQTHAGQQGITESNWQYWDIPSLAPGASFSTTLYVTVPSTETDTTALLHITYDTGDQRLAVIIP